MEQAIIIDLDGTLCNIQHRRHHVENSPKNWELFYKKIPNDKVNSWCKAIINRFYDPRNFYILLVSGRPNTYAPNTIDWLEYNLINYHSLFMRREGDFRLDEIVKKEIYEQEIKGKYNVLFVIDDRKRVVDMWRKEGLVVLHCDEGNF